MGRSEYGVWGAAAGLAAAPEAPGADRPSRRGGGQVVALVLGLGVIALVVALGTRPWAKPAFKFSSVACEYDGGPGYSPTGLGSFDGAEAVVRGRVVATDIRSTGVCTGIRRVTIAVDEVYKGDVGATIEAEQRVPWQIGKDPPPDEPTADRPDVDIFTLASEGGTLRYARGLITRVQAEARVGRLPPMSGQPATTVAAVDLAPATLIAFDDAWHAAGYGVGSGRVASLAECPGGQVVLAHVPEEPRVIDVLDLSGLRRVRSVASPRPQSDTRIDCLDEAGERILVSPPLIPPPDPRPRAAPNAAPKTPTAIEPTAPVHLLVGGEDRVLHPPDGWLLGVRGSVATFLASGPPAAVVRYDATADRELGRVELPADVRGVRGAAVEAATGTVGIAVQTEVSAGGDSFRADMRMYDGPVARFGGAVPFSDIGVADSVLIVPEGAGATFHRTTLNLGWNLESLRWADGSLMVRWGPAGPSTQTVAADGVAAETVPDPKSRAGRTTTTTTTRLPAPFRSPKDPADGIFVRPGAELTLAVPTVLDPEAALPPEVASQRRDTTPGPGVESRSTLFTLRTSALTLGVLAVVAGSGFVAHRRRRARTGGPKAAGPPSPAP